MSKKVLRYSDTKLIKLKKNNSFKSFFVFIFCLSIFLTVMFVSGAFSRVLKVNNFSFLFDKNKISVDTHSYYAVTMGQYDSESEAQSVASGVSIMGAGAYVWLNGNKYYVIGNVYDNLTDAETVLKNVSGNNYDVGILEMKFNKIAFDNENYTTDQKKVILESIKFVDEVFKKCYNYSIKFDKSEVVATVVSSELNTLKGDTTVWAGKLDAINSVIATNETILLKNAYVSINSELDASVLKVIDGSSVNKDLKYLTTAVAVIKYNLYKSINSL